MILEAAIFCLAKNIFYEARGESVIGQYAVAQVTMNRAKGDPKRVCKEVYRPYQFSWTIDPRKSPEQIAPHRWDMALRIARTQLAGKMLMDFTKGATHYHAAYVRPYWASKFKRTVRIGNHIFYA